MLTDRGFATRNARIKSLDIESYQDFVLGFRRWVSGDMDVAAYIARKPQSGAVNAHSGVPAHGGH